MNSIETKTNAIHFNQKGYQALNSFIETHLFSKIFILVDSNTHTHCLPKLMSLLQTTVTIEIIEIEAGEYHKTIDTCVGVWNGLTELGADRKSLMLNLGGGVVTDLGGFVACTFKRGIKYINIPTTLLAMVDASIGGKTGVDLGVLKNQVGVISSSDIVIVDTSYLDTLPQNQMKSGLAEMLKHGLIVDKAYFDKLTNLSKLSVDDLDQLIYDSIVIKKDIVTKDPFEHNERKYLNFGHTLGHAIESHFLSSDDHIDLLHGEAIAIGMILECYISSEILRLSKQDLNYITTTLNSIYKPIEINATDYEAIIELLKYVKKNEHGNINFVLLDAIGSPKINCVVENQLIIKSFEYLNTFTK